MHRPQLSEGISNMEIERLQLDNVEKTENILRILSGLILDTDTLDRVRNVFKSEMALGLQHGLEKVYIHLHSC